MCGVEHVRCGLPAGGNWTAMLVPHSMCNPQYSQVRPRA